MPDRPRSTIPSTTPLVVPPRRDGDALGEALFHLRIGGGYYSACDFSAPWGLELPAIPGALMFHVVTAGECWLAVDGDAPRPLKAGDLALVPHGEGHRVSSAPGAPARALAEVPREEVSERMELLRQGGGGASTTLVCGTVRLDHPAARHLLSLLPRAIAVDGASVGDGAWLRATVQMVAAEAATLRPGGEAVLTRLADVLVIQAIRGWLARDPAARTGWLGALRDPHVGHALGLIHRDPARDWTLRTLAAEVAMSRSAFAGRFTELVGVPAMEYLARWRMLLASTWLRERDTGVGELASRLGYRSEAAFRRAFRRVVGVTPGEVRRGGRDPSSPFVA